MLAGEGGFEPPHTDPESAVLPLDDSPNFRVLYINPAGVSTAKGGPRLKPVALRSARHACDLLYERVRATARMNAATTAAKAAPKIAQG